MLSLCFVEITGRQQLKADITHHVPYMLLNFIMLCQVLLPSSVFMMNIRSLSIYVPLQLKGFKVHVNLK